MLITSYKTKKVVAGDDLFKILQESLPQDLPEKSVVAVASKIIALCEGRVADPEKITRDQLVEQEADYYLPRETNPFDVSLTIKESTFIASAGVDQSNGNGQLVLWPKDVQESANKIREFLVHQRSQRPAQAKFSLSEQGESKGLGKSIGVIVTDSKLSPLRWGVTGVALSHSGFAAIRSYIGTKDVFGRELRVEQVNDADTLAAAAVGVMGEGDEQTPLAVITDIPFVTFVDYNPEEKDQLGKMVDMHNEVFTPILTSVQWKKGRGGE